MSQEDYYNSVLDRVFHSQDSNPVKRDPNKPADSAYFRAVDKIRKQSYSKWYKDQGGEYVIQHKEKEVIDLIKTLVMTPCTKPEYPFIQQKLWSTIESIDEIHQAFVENEK